MSKRSPRLLFTQEERTAPELKKAIRKADRRMKKLENAEAKIPKKTVKKKQRVVDPKTGTVTTPRSAGRARCGGTIRRPQGDSGA